MKPFVYNHPDKIDMIDLEPYLGISNIDSIYSYNNRLVPRVTHILQEMLHEDYLVNWANFIGRVKHQNNETVRDEAFAIGTQVHAAIENYTSKGIIPNFSSDNTEAYTAFNSFLLWWNILTKNEYKILLQEEPLIGQYYGGTLDLLLEVNHKVYLVDFKTSLHLSFKYHLQMAAYRRLLYERGIVLDAIIILGVSKVKEEFKEQFIDLSLPEDIEYINECDRLFMHLVSGYYYRLSIERQFKRF